MAVQKQPHGIVATGAALVTTNDAADLTVRPCSALLVGVGGNIKVTTADGDTLTIPAVPAGVLPLSVVRVWAAETTASSITALY